MSSVYTESQCKGDQTSNTVPQGIKASHPAWVSGQLAKRGFRQYVLVVRSGDRQQGVKQRLRWVSTPPEGGTAVGDQSFRLSVPPRTYHPLPEVKVTPQSTDRKQHGTAPEIRSP